MEWSEIEPVLRASVDRARAARWDDPNRLLTAAEVAEVLGVRVETWHAYVHRGRAPVADDLDLDRPMGRRVYRWRVSTVQGYLAGRKRRAWKLPKAG